MARDNLLTYPYSHETFKIHTDASMIQLVAVISQKGEPIALYSKNLPVPNNGIQKQRENY